MELSDKQKEWLSSVEANCEGGWSLVCGWPDEEHAFEYAHRNSYKCSCGHEWEWKYQRKGQDDWCSECEDLVDPVSSVLDREALSEDLGFYYSWCECCGFTLGGTRHAVSLIKPGEEDYVALKVCTDCLLYIANGDIPDLE